MRQDESFSTRLDGGAAATYLSADNGSAMDGAGHLFETALVPRRVGNLETELTWLRVAGATIPMTRNEGRRHTNYVCCPSAAYLDYAVDELRHFSAHPWLKAGLHGLIEACRPLMRASGLDRQVQPNNWLVSTNLLPDLSLADIAAVTGDLVRQWPGHAVVWRSLNDGPTRDLKQRFEAAGYRAFASRRIYLFDCRNDPPRVGRDERRDRAHLGRGDYAVTDGPWTAADFERMAWLYQKLYLDKYTWLNPVYTADFLAGAAGSGLLSFVGLRSGDGHLDGVIGFFERGDTLTAPVVGYDTGLPAEAALYRRLMAVALGRARASGRLYNMSAGAAAFKRHRGGVAALEYMMVYDRHLGLGRRWAAAGVRALVNGIGIPLLRDFEL